MSLHQQKQLYRSMGCGNSIEIGALQAEGPYEPCPVGKLQIHFHSIGACSEQYHKKKIVGKLRLRLGESLKSYPEVIMGAQTQQIPLTGWKDFVINSQYQGKGRNLSIELANDSVFGEEITCSASVPINQYILSGTSLGPTEIDVVLTKQSTACYRLKISIQFKEIPYKNLSFKIGRVMLTAQSDAQMENREVFVRGIIGEEGISTRPQKQSKQYIPSFEEQLMSFCVPIGLVNSGQLRAYQIMNGRVTLRGRVKFDLDVLLEDETQNKYVEAILDDQGNPQGTMKFFTIATTGGLPPPTFIEPPSPLKANLLNLKSPGLFIRKSSAKEPTIISQNPEADAKKEPVRIIKHFPVPMQNQEDEFDISLDPKATQIQQQQKTEIRKRLKEPLPPLNVSKIRDQVKEESKRRGESKQV